MVSLLILLLVFAAAWLGFLAVGVAVGRQKVVTQRLASLGRTAPTLTDETAPDPQVSLLAPLLAQSRVVEWLEREFWRAGFKLRPTDFLILMVIASLCLGGLLSFLSRSLLLGVLGAAVGAVLPIGALYVAQARRRAALEAQLPDALTMLASAMRSGYSFLQAFQMLASEMPPPMALETGRVLEETSVGVNMDDALSRMVQRVKSYDMDLVVTAILIQRQVGGNLAELLDTIGETVRERFRMRGEIAALTAEGRLSGLILFLMPLGMLGLLSLQSPDYMRPLFQHPIGQMLLGLGLVLQLIGGVVLMKMLKVEV